MISYITVASLKTFVFVKCVLKLEILKYFQLLSIMMWALSGLGLHAVCFIGKSVAISKHLINLKGDCLIPQRQVADVFQECFCNCLFLTLPSVLPVQLSYFVSSKIMSVWRIIVNVLWELDYK